MQRRARMQMAQKVAAAVQNAIQRCRVIYGEKSRAATQTSLDHFFKTVDRIASSKEPDPAPSTSGVSDTAARPVSCCRRPFVSALSCPLSPLQPVVLLACSPDASPCVPTAVLDYLLYFSRYCVVRLRMFIFGVCLSCIICEKYYRPITGQYYIADRVSWVPGLTLLDL